MIGHRGAFGYGKGLSRLESDEEVRRRLIQAMGDRSSLDALRRFWARLHFDPRQLARTTDRMLIDHLAAMTRHGPLAVYLVPDASVKHVLGSAVADVISRRPLRRAAPSVIRGVPAAGSAAGVASPSVGVDAPFASGTPSSVGDIDTKRGDETTSGPLQVALMSLEERMVEVLRRTPRRLPAVLQEQSSRLFTEATMATIVQVLTTWTRMHFVGSGFVLEAVLQAGGLIPTSSAAMEASEKFDESFGLVRQARDERQLDEAANYVAQAIALIGIPAFLAAVWRGANRFMSANKR
jgi:hypothetical protein